MTLHIYSCKPTTSSPVRLSIEERARKLFLASLHEPLSETVRENLGWMLAEWRFDSVRFYPPDALAEFIYYGCPPYTSLSDEELLNEFVIDCNKGFDDVPGIYDEKLVDRQALVDWLTLRAVEEVLQNAS